MARSITLKAELNFELVDHAEYGDMRTKVVNFVNNNNGSADFETHEEIAEGGIYLCKVQMDFPAATRSAAASLMNTIDNNLSTLPQTYITNSFKLRYTMVEVEL